MIHGDLNDIFQRLPGSDSRVCCRLASHWLRQVEAVVDETMSSVETHILLFLFGSHLER